MGSSPSAPRCSPCCQLPWPPPCLTHVFVGVTSLRTDWSLPNPTSLPLSLVFHRREPMELLQKQSRIVYFFVLFPFLFWWGLPGNAQNKYPKNCKTSDKTFCNFCAILYKRFVRRFAIFGVFILIVSTFPEPSPSVSTGDRRRRLRKGERNRLLETLHAQHSYTKKPCYIQRPVARPYWVTTNKHSNKRPWTYWFAFLWFQFSIFHVSATSLHTRHHSRAT